MPAPLILAPILAAAGGMLSRVVFSKAGPWIASALVFLGIELFAGAAVIDPMRDAVASHMSGLPADVTAWMGVLQLDRYITIVISAYIAVNVKKAIVRRRAA